MKLAIIAIILFYSQAAHAAEQNYAKKWCELVGGEYDVALPDKNKCGCLTPSHVFEFEPPEKWPKALGRAIRRAKAVGKKPGVALVKSGEGGDIYTNRLAAVIDQERTGIAVLTITTPSKGGKSYFPITMDPFPGDDFIIFHINKSAHIYPPM